MALSEAERQLLVELLQREKDDLPVEIHHTRTAAVREELSRRRELVRELLERMRSVLAS